MSISASYPTLRPTLLLDFANSGRLDPRVTFTRASTATYFDETGVLQSAAIDVPRFDYDPDTLAARGFLIEESRTNSIRNNTMQGAVAGTPGTLPTNWGAVVNGLTQEIVGTGTVNGITYIDIKFSGTTTGPNTSITFETTGIVTASTGQNWSLNSWISVIAGSTTNITAARLIVDERSIVYLTSQNGPDIITSLSSVLQRFNFTATLANAATTNIQPIFRFTSATGAAIDITLRIGMPQLELGAFATSVIPTTTTALTRSADVASVNTLSPWYNAAEGTFVAQSLVTGGFTNFVSRFVGAATNIYMANGYVSGAGIPTAASYLRNSTAAQISIVSSSKVAGTVYKEANRYSSTSFREAANGTLGNDVTPSAGIPTVSKLDFAPAAGSTASTAVGQLWMQRFTYYPRSFSDAELTSISA